MYTFGNLDIWESLRARQHVSVVGLPGCMHRDVTSFTTCHDDRPRFPWEESVRAVVHERHKALGSVFGAALAHRCRARREPLKRFYELSC